jgi:sporulation protein YlmC with PRC-barrel domain
LQLTKPAQFGATARVGIRSLVPRINLGVISCNRLLHLPAGQVAETGTVAVSQLKLVSGLRASKLIGAAVYNDANERIGTVDDLILSPEDKAVAAIVQVGGFLGVGGKLVAVPYHQLQADKDNKLVLAGANKDSLNVMPGFTYGG